MKRYRLYTDFGKGYINDIKTNEITELFKRLDVLILEEYHKYCRYLVIENKDEADSPIFLSHGEKERYLEFKERETPKIKKLSL